MKNYNITQFRKYSNLEDSLINESDLLKDFIKLFILTFIILAIVINPLKGNELQTYEDYIKVGIVVFGPVSIAMMISIYKQILLFIKKRKLSVSSVYLVGYGIGIGLLLNDFLLTFFSNFSTLGKNGGFTSTFALLYIPVMLVLGWYYMEDKEIRKTYTAYSKVPARKSLNYDDVMLQGYHYKKEKLLIKFIAMSIVYILLISTVLIFTYNPITSEMIYYYLTNLVASLIAIAVSVYKYKTIGKARKSLFLPLFLVVLAEFIISAYFFGNYTSSYTLFVLMITGFPVEHFITYGFLRFSYLKV